VAKNFSKSIIVKEAYELFENIGPVEILTLFGYTNSSFKPN